MERCRTRPPPDSAEAGVSRPCLSKRKKHYDTHGGVGLQDGPSVPRSSPSHARDQVLARQRVVPHW
ncbi:hypothetical protein [Streptomyces sp. NPDC001604]|uniref:hypothetical protein n=1 Tax=Streptomyces sp. NPDC001604 TaxID=3364593 RepID=UPI0036A99E11